MMRLLALTGLAAALTLAGCDLTTSLVEERLVGAIGYPDNLDITVPDTVQAGEAFTVTVRTLAPNGCWRKDRTEVRVSGLIAQVTPYDIYRVERDENCTAEPVSITHTATVTFGSAGDGRVDILGREGTASLPVLIE